MKLDDETTAQQLHALLTSKGYALSLNMILRCRSSLGWTFRGSAYCQLIREDNKLRRFEWALANKLDDFENVIFTNECTVQMETHRRYCCRKQGEAPRPKPRPKHPYKVHVWAGISLRGKSGICIFNGIMDRFLYVDILKKTLLPFVEHQFSDGHRFMADNYPKHNSIVAREFFSRKWYLLVAHTSRVSRLKPDRKSLA